MGAKQKHVLVAVLDWGLGHATRCIPLVHQLLQHNCKVTLAGSGPSLHLIKQEYPQLSVHHLPPYNIAYSKKIVLPFHLLFQLPRILKTIDSEHTITEQFIRQHQVDAIISDNRYGCYSEKVTSILITHQLNIQLPYYLLWANGFVKRTLTRLLSKFNQVWVPDLLNSVLSGKLSSSNSGHDIRFIGLLSRFTFREVPVNEGIVAAIVSGPEPQREILEGILKKSMLSSGSRSFLVRGLPNLPNEEHSIDGLTILNHAPTDKLENIISAADIIIARSGYSTIMDLCVLKKKKVIFIPTPGQTEQEYLAEWMNKKGIAFTCRQNQFDMEEALQKVKSYHGFDTFNNNGNLLDDAVNNLLASV